MIKSQSAFDLIYHTYFHNSPMYIKAGNAARPIEFVKYDGNYIFLRIGPEFDPSKPVIVLAKTPSETIYTSLQHVSAFKGQIFAFRPVQIQIIRQQQEAAPKVKRDDSIYLDDVVTDHLIRADLNMAEKKVDRIKWDIAQKLGKMFHSSKTVFLHERINDSRLKIINQIRQPYFIPNIQNLDPTEPVQNYHEVFQADQFVRSNRFVSEICLPVLYKRMLPMGYVLINDTSPMTAEKYSAARKLGIAISNMVTVQRDFIRTVEERFSMSDWAPNNLDILLDSKAQIKYFKDDCMLLFRVNLGKERSAAILSRADLDGANQRVHAQILDIDPIGEAHYSEFLEELGDHL